MENKGITLIALVITVIVLLILAAVSLSTLVGNNGILARAATVEEEYSKGELEEQFIMIVNQKLIDAYKIISINTESDEDISTQFNEEILINYLTDPNGDNSNDDAYIEIGYNASTITPVIAPDDSTFVLYNLYYIYASRVVSNIDSIGTGENDGTLKNVFMLEAITIEEADEDGNTITKSTGEYNIVYYNSSSETDVIASVYLYLTNKS